MDNLSLDQNQLTEIPIEIGNLKGLAGLSAGTNQLRTLPPEIGQLSNLEILWLPGNQLSTLPSEISDLTKMSRLNLYDNQLRITDESLAAWLDTTSPDWDNSQTPTWIFYFPIMYR